MPFLEFKYSKRGPKSKEKAKEKLAYVGKDKEETKRFLFNANGPITKEEALEQIDLAPLSVLFFRMILSPDVKTENIGKMLDLWDLTQKLVEHLAKKLQRKINFISSVHNDTDNPHTHTLLFINRYGRERPITPARIQELRDLAAGQSLDQQRHRHLMQAVLQEPEQRSQGVQPLAGAAGGKAKRTRQDFARPTPILQVCPNCGPAVAMRKTARGQARCPA